MPTRARDKGRNASARTNGDIRVVIADDHRSFGEALQIALDGERDLTVIEVVTDGETAVEVAHDQRPDVVLMETRAVADLADALRRAYRGEPLHAAGEVEQSLARFRIQRRAEGRLAQRVERLTPRELEILQRIAAGENSAEISEGLGMSRHTLRTHVQNVLTKLGVHSKTDAVVAAIRFGKVRTNEKASQWDVDAS